MAKHSFALTVEGHFSGCKGKHRYESQSLAAAVAKHSRRRKSRESINAYRCASCHGWHIGSSNPVARQKTLDDRRRMKEQRDADSQNW